MNWSEFSIHTTQFAVEPICNILHEAGASGVVIEDPADLVKLWDVSLGEVYQLSPDDYPEEGVIVKAYFPVNEQFDDTIVKVKKAINELPNYDIDIGQNKVLLHEVKEEEWETAWKKYYKPVKVSNTIRITPTWEDYEPTKEDEIIIELDPGMAFGTGTHPTTVLSLQALEKELLASDRVIDVGTGTGVLSIAAAKLGASHVLALDLDEIAVKSAITNVKLNKVEEFISVKQNNLLQGIKDEVDLVIANILAEVIVHFTDDAARVLKRGGTFITSGIITRKKLEVESALRASGFEVVEINESDDWVAMIAKKL